MVINKSVFILQITNKRVFLLQPIYIWTTIRQIKITEFTNVIYKNQVLNMRKSNQEIKDNISESIRKIRCTAINLAEEEH